MCHYQKAVSEQSAAYHLLTGCASPATQSSLETKNILENITEIKNKKLLGSSDDLVITGTAAVLTDYSAILQPGEAGMWDACGITRKHYGITDGLHHMLLCWAIYTRRH